MKSMQWVVDSGASALFSAARENFVTLILSESGNVAGISVLVRGRGTCKLTMINSSGHKCIVTLKGALYILDLNLRSNRNFLCLLSVPVATSKGCKFSFSRTIDTLWTPEGHALGMFKSNGQMWLSTINQFLGLTPSTLLSK